MPSVRPTGAPAGAARFAAAAAGLFVALAAAVRTGLLDAVDRRGGEAVRPGGSWGDLHRRMDVIVEGLRPEVAAVLLVLVAVVVASRSRRLRPSLLAVATLGAAIVVTLLAQAVVGRPDPQGTVGVLGGSFPSGHTVTATVATGLVVRLLLPARRVVAVVAATVVGVAMGVAMVVQTAHWASDAAGGLLLAGAVLAGHAALDGRRSPADPAAS